MKSTNKALENCQVEFVFEYDAEEMKAIVKKVEKEYFKHASIPGFRRGKVPPEIIRKEFAGQIANDVKRAMISEEDKIKAEVQNSGLDVFSLASVTKCDYTADGGSMTFIYEVYPGFEVPDYKSIKIDNSEASLPEGAVDEYIESIRSMVSSYEDAKEGEIAGAKDFVQVDYSGIVDGKSVGEVAPEAKALAQGNGFWSKVNGAGMLPGLFKCVEGMKAGETKDGVEVEFGDVAPEALKGKKGVYSITLKAFRKLVPADDAKVLEAMKAANMDELKERLQKEMLKEAEAANLSRRREEAAQALLKGQEFSIPASLQSRFLNVLARNVAQSYARHFTAEEDLKAAMERDGIYDKVAEQAAKNARLFCVCRKIAQAEKIESDNTVQSVIDFILAQ